MQLFFADNFNRANAGNLGGNYTNVYGSPAVNSNQARKGTLAAWNESLAVLASYTAVDLVEIRAVTSGGGMNGNPILAFGERVDDEVFDGVFIYLGATFANMFLNDDTEEDYTQLASGSNIGSLSSQQLALRLERTSTHLNISLRRTDTDAATFSESFPLTSLPAHFNWSNMRPAIGFLDNASNTHWIDDLEVWIPDDTPEQHGFEGDAFAFAQIFDVATGRGSAPGSTGADSTQTANVIARVSTGGPADAAGTWGARQLEHAALVAAGEAGEIWAIFADVPGAAPAAGDAQAGWGAVIRAQAGFSGAGAAESGQGGPARAGGLVTGETAGSAALAALQTALVALVAAGEAGESWAGQAVALVELIADGAAASSVAAASEELRDALWQAPTDAGAAFAAAAALLADAAGIADAASSYAAIVLVLVTLAEHADPLAEFAAVSGLTRRTMLAAGDAQAQIEAVAAALQSAPGITFAAAQFSTAGALVAAISEAASATASFRDVRAAARVDNAAAAASMLIALAQLLAVFQADTQAVSAFSFAGAVSVLFSGAASAQAFFTASTGGAGILILSAVTLNTAIQLSRAEYHAALNADVTLN